MSKVLKFMQQRLRWSSFRPWVLGAFRLSMLAWAVWVTYALWWLHHAVFSLAHPVQFMLRVLRAHGMI